MKITEQRVLEFKWFPRKKMKTSWGWAVPSSGNARLPHQGWGVNSFWQHPKLVNIRCKLDHKWTIEVSIKSIINWCCHPIPRSSSISKKDWGHVSFPKEIRLSFVSIKIEVIFISKKMEVVFYFQNYGGRLPFLKKVRSSSISNKYRSSSISKKMEVVFNFQNIEVVFHFQKIEVFFHFQHKLRLSSISSFLSLTIQLW